MRASLFPTGATHSSRDLDARGWGQTFGPLIQTMGSYDLADRLVGVTDAVGHQPSIS